MKKIYVRCKQCDMLAYVDYDGYSVACPKCGAMLLDDNDKRVPEDYVESNGNDINVIGDSIDDYINGLAPKDENELLEGLLKAAKDSHIREEKKFVVDIADAEYLDTVEFGNKFWLALKNNGDRCLLITKSCEHIDFDYQYNPNTHEREYSFEEKCNYEWESSLYRKYLNGYYLDTFFTDEEKARILTFDTPIVSADGTIKVVNDKVFFLNKEEVEQYFPKRKDRISFVHIIFKDVKRPWLLRNTKEKQDCPDLVNVEGDFEILSKGYVVDTFRPALWIKM